MELRNRPRRLRINPAMRWVVQRPEVCLPAAIPSE